MTMSSRAWTPPSLTWTSGKKIRKHPAARGETGRETFPCQYVCAECGWLADLDDAPCPDCERVAWIDLSHITTAQALRDHEREHPRAESDDERIFDLGLIGLFGAWSAAGIALTVGFMPLLGGVAALASGALLVAGLQGSVGAALRRRAAAKLPQRRRLALPPAEGLVGSVRGHATPASTLRSPVGDVLCLAWRVRAVVRDGSASDLVIDDGRSAAFELGDRRFEADAVELAEAVEPVALGELEPEARARVIRFLRARGCFSHEGEWMIEERCVALAEPVVVDGRGDQAAPILRRDDDAPRSPYR